MKLNSFYRVASMAVIVGMLSGFSPLMHENAAADNLAMVELVSEEMTFIEITESDMVPLAQAPVSFVGAVASGTVVEKNAKAEVDVSNTKDGYIMVKYLGSNSKVKIQLTGPSGVTYTYNVTTPGKYEVFPLSDGSGNYKVGIFENTSGTKYAVAFSIAQLKAQLGDEFAPFLRPNQYVNYDQNSKCVALAKQLKGTKTDELEIITEIYGYVIKNITYDTALAASVSSGYLPKLDNVLQAKKGICFDYASLMTAMLRSVDIPTKLVVGYTGGVYHAWINIYSAKSGWMDGVIYFDGTQWNLMDPTFASGSNGSQEILSYIGDGKNYSAKYLY